MNTILNIFLIVAVIQYIIMKIFEINNFDIFSYTKNLIFAIILLSVFTKQKLKIKHLNKILNKGYSLLLIIPIIYLIQYLYYPSYVGQDILALPFTTIGYLTTNLQKLQNENMYNKFLHDASIDLNDTNYNFWYEYYNFSYDNFMYYFWLNRPGKYDEYLNCLCYYVDLNTGIRKILLQTQFPKEDYKSTIENETKISEISNHKLNYKLIINMKTRKKFVNIKFDALDVTIDGYITMRDNYSGILVTNEYIPITNLLRVAGISDTYPYELMNDTVAISDCKVNVNGISHVGISWFDVYVGNGYYYMTNYLWTMNYTENWNVFILFYTDYPYKGLVVSFFYNKKLDKTIECGNFFPNNNRNKMLTGTTAEIDVFDTRLTTNDFKYEVNYNSPKIKCRVKSKYIFKALDNFPLYERLSDNKDYGKGEELHRVAEQLRYDEFAGRSEVYLEYDNKVYNEESKTVIDGVSWQPGKTGPDGYKKRDDNFFNEIFYVEHPNSDELNGKLY